MAAQTPRIDNIEAVIGTGIDLQYTTAPHTAVQNRAPIVDLSKDGMPRMGSRRITFHDLMRLHGETGPNGQDVYKPSNDVNDQIRFYGDDVEQEINAARGNRTLLREVGDTMEVTFYGTGLNLLAYMNSNASRDYRVTIDGGAESGNIYPGAGDDNADGVQGNSPMNVIVPLAENLSFGWHTVKVRNNNATNFSFHGVEIRYDRSDVLVTEFTRSNGVTYPATQLSVDSGFETGTLGSTGGRVLIYAKNDGTIGHALNVVGTASTSLGTVDHTGEEVFAHHHPREFSAQTTNDWSLIYSVASGTAYQTLLDNTTALVGQDVRQNGGSFDVDPYEYMRLTGSNDVYVFTFYGTGCDMLMAASASGSDHAVTVDGVSYGNISFDSADNKEWVELCSNLKMGSHIVEIQRGASADVAVYHMRTYMPTRPTLPDNAIELGEYTIPATFTANTTGGNAARTDISQGTVSTSNVREILYQGTGWSELGTSNSRFGSDFRTSTAGDTATKVFWGTGIAVRDNSSASSTHNISVDGSTDLSGFTRTGIGDATLSAAGVYTGGSGANNGFIIEGLSLGWHTIVLEQDDAGQNFIPQSYNIIQPLYMPDTEKGTYQANFMRKHGTIKDLRETGQYQPPHSFANLVGNVSWSVNDDYLPLGLVSTIHLEKESLVEMNFHCHFEVSGGNRVKFRFVVDGVIENLKRASVDNNVNGKDPNTAMSIRKRLPKGDHTIYVLVDTNTTSNNQFISEGTELSVRVIE